MRIIIESPSNTDPNADWEWAIETREGGDYTEPAKVRVVASGIAENVYQALQLANDAAVRHFKAIERRKS